jgi:hypothetical protein
VQDVIAQRDAIAAWAGISYGWMGRSPHYKAAFLNTLGANAEFYEKFADNARAFTPLAGRRRHSPRRGGFFWTFDPEVACRPKRTAIIVP